MQKWTMNVQRMRDKQAQRTNNQEKNKKLVAQAINEMEEIRKKVEELQKKTCVEAHMSQELEDQIKEVQAKNEGRRNTEASIFTSGRANVIRKLSWLGRRRHWNKVLCKYNGGGAANAQGGAAQEETRQSPIDVETTEPAKGNAERKRKR